MTKKRAKRTKRKIKTESVVLKKCSKEDFKSLETEKTVEKQTVKPTEKKRKLEDLDLGTEVGSLIKIEEKLDKPKILDNGIIIFDSKIENIVGISRFPFRCIDCNEIVCDVELQHSVKCEICKGLVCRKCSHGCYCHQTIYCKKCSPQKKLYKDETNQFTEFHTQKNYGEGCEKCMIKCSCGLKSFRAKECGTCRKLFCPGCCIGWNWTDSGKNKNCQKCGNECPTCCAVSKCVRKCLRCNKYFCTNCDAALRLDVVNQSTPLMDYCMECWVK
jgi:hypothetical protein